MASPGSMGCGRFSVVARSHGLAAEFFGSRKISCAVDATLGGGRDALFLASLVSEGGKVYGFDIQPEAVSRSRGLFEKNGLSDRSNFSMPAMRTWRISFRALSPEMWGAFFSISAGCPVPTSR